VAIKRGTRADYRRVELMSGKVPSLVVKSIQKALMVFTNKDFMVDWWYRSCESVNI